MNLAVQDAVAAANALAALPKALLRLRAVRDLPARIISFGIWPVHPNC